MTNPVELWSVRQLLLTTGVLLVAVFAAGALIYRSDAHLRASNLPRSSALEWEHAPSAVARVTATYREQQVVGEVVRGTLLDTVALIPSYAALLAIACFWAARSLAAPWSTLGLVLGWGGLVAGGLDLIENAGILVEVVLGWSFAAPLTNAACWLKWTLATSSAGFALVAAIGHWLTD
jgi:hypothetical protein